MDPLLARELERLVVTSAVPLLLWIGYQLFVKGATGQMSLVADAKAIKGKAANVAPGALCFILAVSLGAYIMFSRVELQNGTGRTVSMLGGPGAERLSTTLRRVLSDEAMTVMAGDDAEQARQNAGKVLSQKLLRIPSLKNVQEIEETEQRASVGDKEAQRKLQELEATYIKPKP